MEATFIEMNSIFQRTKAALVEFKEMITPIFDNATDEHERLYWHHIYEEEDHRADRLELLLPTIEKVISNKMKFSNNMEVIHLLQDISLEKFGLHNFLEHLDLSLFQFRGTELEGRVQAIRDFTYDDYQRMKAILNTLNEAFNVEKQLTTAIPTDEKDGIADSLKIDTYAEIAQQNIGKSNIKVTRRQGLTVGSLKKLRGGNLSG